MKIALTFIVSVFNYRKQDIINWDITLGYKMVQTVQSVQWKLRSKGGTQSRKKVSTRV